MKGVNCANITKDRFTIYQSLSKQQILDSSKLKEFTDNNSKFDENGRKFSKRVENTG